MIRDAIRAAGFMAAVVLTAVHSFAQSSRDLEKFFRENIGLNDDQIAEIQKGQPVAKAMPPRSPSEVFLFGAIYIHADPESYYRYIRDLERLRKLPGYLALGVNRNPPQLADWKGFSFDSDDIQALKECKPGDCKIQMPADAIEELGRVVDLSASDASERVNQLLQKAALEHLRAYQSEGNHALGVYNDKRNPVEVARQFAYLLSYLTAFPEYLPAFYHYLLTYPEGKPANVDDSFYWARVKFGLKPTLRMIHVVTLRGGATDRVAYVVAEKQLYASHYFETALDLSFCLRGSAEGEGPGFYLVMTLGSEQAGLTGAKGSIVRKAAVGRSVSSLHNALDAIRSALESNRGK